MRRARPALVGIALAALLLALLPASRAAADPSDVRAGVFITAIHGIDFAGGTVETTFWLWSVHNSAELGPTFGFDLVNARQWRTDVSGSDPLPDGLVYSFAKITATLSQRWDGKNVPLDRQFIDIVLEPRDLDAARVRLVPDTRDSRVGGDVKLLGWAIEPMTVSVELYRYQSNFGAYHRAAPDAFSRLQVRVPILREGPFRLFNSYIGFFLAMVLSGLSYFISGNLLQQRLTICGAATFAAMTDTFFITKEFAVTSGWSLSGKIQFAAFLVLSVAFFNAIACAWLHERGRLDRAFALNRALGIVSTVLGVLIVLLGAIGRALLSR